MPDDLLEEIRKSRETFLDISRLGSPDLNPLIQRALHHLEELRRNIGDDNSENVKKLSPLLRKGLEATLEDEFLSLGSLQSQTISISPDVTMFEWKELMRHLPIVKDFVKNFPFQDSLDVSFKDGRLELISFMPDSIDLASTRSYCYSVTKTLLASAVILTYQLVDTDQGQVIKCNFDFKRPPGEALVYNMDDGVAVGLDPRLFSYALGEDAGTPDCHIFINVDSKGRAERFPEIPEGIFTANHNNDIINLPFLFRHIVLCLPGHGRLLKERTAGSIEPETNYYFMDLFSLIAR